MTQPLIISVGGGKGGVGKSVVAANLGVAFAQLGFRTVVVDTDLGAANQHTLFGIDRPGRTLQSLLDKEVSSLEEVSHGTGIPRLFVVPGVGAIPGAANLAHVQKQKVVRKIKAIDAEVIVLDVGAGVSYNVIDFYEVGDLRLVVTSPQLTAMQNAYCFMKAAVHRGIRHRMENHAQREALSDSLARSETDRVRDLRRRLTNIDAGLDGAFTQVLSGFATHIIGNMLDHRDQRKVLASLSRMVHDFLDVNVPILTALPMSRLVHESVTRRHPFVLNPAAKESRDLLIRAAETLASVDVEAIRRIRSTPVVSRIDEGRPSHEALLGVSLIDYLRRDERIAVDHEVTVHTRARSGVGRLCDISPRGTMVESSVEARVGDPISLTLTGLPAEPSLTGIVRHVAVSGRHFGVELDEPSLEVASILMAPHAPRRSSRPPARLAS